MEQGNVNSFMNGYVLDRPEPEGPGRYLQTANEIRAYMKRHSRIVSHILVDCAVLVLSREFNFSDEQLQAFTDELQKEISER